MSEVKSKLTLTKFDKIQIVKKLGLNTEDSVLLKTYESNPFNTNVSIRTQDKTKVFHSILPHYPVVRTRDYERIVKQILADGYEAIVAKCINPVDCLFSGTVMKDDSKFIIELAYGPYTTRRVTHDGIIDERYEVPIGGSIANPQVNEILMKLMAVKKLPTKCIFEVSYYKIPVGIKKEKIIFWEVHDA
jgi:hypothetical protein